MTLFNKFRSLWAFMILLLLASALTSVAKAQQTCSFPSDCPSGYQCSGGSCVMGSWPNGGCSFDSDCQSGYQCSGGSCVMGSWPNGGCSFASDCQAGYQCSGGTCVMGKWPDGGCSFDSDCQAGYVCSQGSCTYNNNSETFVNKLTGKKAPVEKADCQ